jgi:hypothetical protein
MQMGVCPKKGSGVSDAGGDDSEDGGEHGTNMGSWGGLFE